MKHIFLALIFLTGFQPEIFPKEVKSSKVILTPLTPREHKRLKRNSPDTLKKIEKNKPLNLYDIKVMTRSGVSDDAIISAIETTHSTFFLTSADVTDLRQAGVSQRVLEKMNETGKYHYSS